MPLGGTEEKIQIDHNDSRNVAAAVSRGSYLLEAARLLWSGRRSIGVWLVVGLVISAVLGYRVGKYEATTQIMPPDGSSSSGLAGLAPLVARMSGAASLAGDAMGGVDILGGAKSSTALFSKVLVSRTIQDKLVERFDLRTRY